MVNNQPIGIFDSGVGGTSIWKEIHKMLPLENTIYLSDSKNAPYGEKSKKEILSLSIKNTDYLIRMGCKMIVVACNTATTNAIKELRELYDIPFIGIEPAIKPAALRSKTQIIGILATKGTLNSELFHSAVLNYPNTKIIEQIGTGLVKMIENGQIESPEMAFLLKRYLEPMIKSEVDYLVLGCSHYPYLIPQIKKIIPSNVTIIDSGEAVARQTKKILEEKTGFSNDINSKQLFYINQSSDVLKNLLNHAYPVIDQDF